MKNYLSWKELNVEYANNLWLDSFWEQSGMELFCTKFYQFQREINI